MKCKCSECGLLTVRDEYNDEPCEATEFTRKKGQHKSSNGTTTTAKVFCYAASSTFPEQPGPGLGKGQWATDHVPPVVTTIEQEIECIQFCSWRPGKSPKEHEELITIKQLTYDVEKAEEESSERENTRRKEDQDWQQKVEADIERRHKEVQTSRRTQLLVQFLFALLASVVTLIGSKLLPMPQDFDQSPSSESHSKDTNP
ncbi:MAG: hypothetical protein ACKVII_05560 [Planctomycetales bacterium]|jgi:hypothetical protein